MSNEYQISRVGAARARVIAKLTEAVHEIEDGLAVRFQFSSKERASISTAMEELGHALRLLENRVDPD